MGLATFHIGGQAVAWIERYTHRDGKHSWRVGWRTPEGRSRSKAFRHRRDADDFIRRLEGDKAGGDYQDPSLGRITIGQYFETFMEQAQHLKPSTRSYYRDSFARYACRQCARERQRARQAALEESRMAEEAARMGKALERQRRERERWRASLRAPSFWEQLEQEAQQELRCPEPVSMEPPEGVRPQAPR